MLRKFVAMLLVAITVLSVLSSCTSHEHSFDEEEIIEATSCTKAGKKVLKCSCGETKTQSIPKAHAWSESECGEMQYCTAGEHCSNYVLESKVAERRNPNSHTLDYATKTCKTCGRSAISVDLPDNETKIRILNARSEVIAELLVSAEVDVSFTTTTSVTIRWSAEKISNGDSSDDKMTETLIKYKLSEIVGIEDAEDHKHKIVDGFCSICEKPEFELYAKKSGTNDANVETELGDKVKDQTFTIHGLDLWGKYKLEFVDVYAS